MITLSESQPEITASSCARTPWFGYELGYWPDSWERAAQRAIHGEYLDTGKEYEQLRTRSSYFDGNEPPQENS